MFRDQDPINLYHKYREEKRSPFLLESLGPKTSYSSKTILARDPKRKLVCKNGILFENERPLGDALDIFSHLRVAKSHDFFPAWMGFFGYEFARYTGLPSKSSPRNIPDAVFYYYEDGHVWDHSEDNFPQGSDSPNGNEVYATSEDAHFFAPAFAQVAQNITDGNVYQVNIAQRFSFDAEQISFFELYKRLRINNPSPFMGLIEDDSWAIACASPERLFCVKDSVISSRPIAGTRPRGTSSTEDMKLETELLSSTKERAEHAMLVDLVRNDLARICDVGTVTVDEAFIVERYSHVMHLVSEVSGNSSASLQEQFASLFPAGTITGTPKESAMEQIRDLEPFARGPYTGSMGYVSGHGTDFNILIRSAFRDQKKGHLWAGAGIVAQSNAPFEGNEVAYKAGSVSYALRNVLGPSVAAHPKHGQIFAPSMSTKRFHQKVLFVENHDSFSHNIVDGIRSLGCQVDIVDHHSKPDLSGYNHVVFGPGPKQPSEAGLLMQWLKEAIRHECAILGICLGHQALGHYFGARLSTAKRAIHGEVERVSHTGHPLFVGVPNTFAAMRYHSLILSDLPDSLNVIARSSTDEIMAIAHKDHPWFGVQFHPESFLSESGQQIFENFFELST